MKKNAYSEKDCIENKFSQQLSASNFVWILYVKYVLLITASPYKNHAQQYWTMIAQKAYSPNTTTDDHNHVVISFLNKKNSVEIVKIFKRIHMQKKNTQEYESKIETSELKFTDFFFLLLQKVRVKNEFF